MLILSRKSGESIVIDGRIHVKIVRVEGEVVKVGIEAPSDVPVHRQEVYEEIQRSNHLALTQQSSPLPKLARAHPGKQGAGQPDGTSGANGPMTLNLRAGDALPGQVTRLEPPECPAIIVGRK